MATKSSNPTSRLKSPSSAPKFTLNPKSLAAVFLPPLLFVFYLKWNTFVVKDASVSVKTPTTYKNIRSGLSAAQVPKLAIAGPEAVSNAGDAAHAADSPEPAKHWMDEMSERYAQACPKHQYNVRLFSHDPLIIYLENFISEPERTYMLHAAESDYLQSGLIDDDTGVSKADTTIRSSTTAMIYAATNPVAACLKQRSAELQGNVQVDQVEDLQVVRYQQGQQYKHQYDWFANREMANPRISTIFTYLACDSGVTGEGECHGGSTQFPLYAREYQDTWCDVVDCENTDRLQGVGFKPIEGNAVYWSNVVANGSAFHVDTLHAGIPVKAGRKVGLNVWTRWTAYDPDVDF